LHIAQARAALGNPLTAALTATAMPQMSDESGGILFWMETSDVPVHKSGRAAKKPKSRLPPFCIDIIF
jgi:hypothetical protein